ncbi:MAG: indoleacetamide hydrolase [Pseudomonadota bacterium]
MGQDQADWDAVATLAAFASGTLSPADYVDGIAARIDAHAALNAIASFDAAHVRAEATAARAAAPAAPLAGLPLVVKDNINTRTYPTTAGTGALAGHTPATDAPVVTRVLASGGVVGAKANLHELAFGITSNNAVTGAVRNPHDPSLIAGGSSGGTAAAIAGGVFAAGLGTDTGGSLRVPASLCGIVGFRPSTGRYPSGGVVPITHTRDVAGPMARSVRDIDLLDGVLSGEATPVASLAAAQLTLGVPRAVFYDNLDPHTASVIEAQLSRLATAGVRLVEVSLDAIWPHNAAIGFPVSLYEVMRDLPDYLAEHAPHVSFEALVAGIGSPDVAAVVASQRGDEAIPEAVYRAALEVHQPALRAAYAGVFAAHALDALVFPTTPLPARPVGQDETVDLNGVAVPTFTTYIRNTDVAPNLGAPAISLPCPTGDALPVGLELDGLPGADRALLAAALTVERVLAG